MSDHFGTLYMKGLVSLEDCFCIFQSLFQSSQPLQKFQWGWMTFLPNISFWTRWNIRNSSVFWCFKGGQKGTLVNDEWNDEVNDEWNRTVYSKKSLLELKTNWYLGSLNLLLQLLRYQQKFLVKRNCNKTVSSSLF